MTGIIVDNFAGGGGASIGIMQALGRAVDVAINHDPIAIAMHRTNHPDEPAPTVTAGGLHIGEVRAFLLKYYGTGTGQNLNDPAHAVTTKDRIGLVAVHGEDYQIVDIGMRMLQPHELFAAQGFPADYIIDRDDQGNRFSKAQQVALCGNSVPPDLARVLVESNLPEMCGKTHRKEEGARQ